MSRNRTLRSILARYALATRGLLHWSSYFLQLFDNLISMQDRIEVFCQMLEADPSNTVVMFGLAKEYEKLGQHDKVIAMLENYLTAGDDEGNAFGVLANAYAQTGNREAAIDTYKKGIDVAMAHGHPSMANEYRMTLDLDFAD